MTEQQRQEDSKDLPGEDAWRVILIGPGTVATATGDTPDSAVDALTIPAYTAEGEMR